MRSGLLKSYAGVWSALFQSLDLCVIGMAGLVAGWLYVEPETFQSTNYAQLMVIGLLVSGLTFNRLGVYQAWRGRSLFGEISRISIAWSSVVIVLSVFVFLTKSGSEYSRIWGALWFCFGLVALVLLRVVLRICLRALRRMGYNQRQVVLVGYPKLIQELAIRFESSLWLGLTVKQTFDVDAMAMPELVEMAESGQIDQVWIVLPLKEEERLKSLTDALALTSVEIKYVPDLFGLRLFSHSLTEVEGLPVLNLCSTPMQGFNRLIKEIEDRFFSLFFLILLSPLMILIALGVKLSSPGPIFFKQERMGWGGKRINVLKFRSMVVHQEEANKLTQATKNDTRVTPLGGFLRRTSLDELPQFINVLMGDMSVVGPRPHAMAHNDQYKTLVDDYMHRHRVKPGLTGWAQINGYRGETDTLEKMQRRVEYDLYYIENWSFWLDLKIIVLTVFKGFFNKNAY